MSISLVAVAQVLVGLLLLTFAADRLVVAAARLSRLWGLSPILIGAVVVGLGTSLPEMLVSGLAAARPGGMDLALGNIVGSNVANLSLVLGTSVMLSPIVGQRLVLKREGMLMLLGSVLLSALAWNNQLGIVEGVVLAVSLLIALGLMTYWSRVGSDAEVAAEVDEFTGGQTIRPAVEAVFGLGSLALTLIGARLLVSGAEEIALELGISEAVIGLTLVAIGTSLPELATALAAARRKENDIVLGNVLGSNLFNALGVGGVAGMVGNSSFTADFRGPLVAMLGVSLLAGLLALAGNRLDRWKGAVLLVTYPLVVIFL